jgi:hypothetical protein
MNTLAEQLAATLRSVAHAFPAGDQVAPCAVLWPDPDRWLADVRKEVEEKLKDGRVIL